MAFADLALLLANAVYATSYVATRVVLDAVPPATLALLRLLVGALILVPLAWRTPWTGPVTRADHWRIAAMGVAGFAGAFAFTHWGLARSTATNAALLIAVEPLTLLLLGPALLGERLTRRERAGAACALTGAALVVVNGIPGITARLVPHWRGDLLLVLSGVAYAAYSLLGRPVLVRHPALPVTARSILWGIPVLVPLALMEWMGGRRPAWTSGALLGALYLAVVITALGYLIWNWALERVTASHAAIFLNVQPVLGALLGVALLGEPLTVFTLGGGALVVAGLVLTVRSGAAGAVYS
ncbi:MAG: hypothetical protein AUH29_03020 [Candidatus Rokubacteria bacterium 13_1_40CM_69_27]|nr:MAG: hypothetical protein AUH29_03020 [Candidatus Rokubacteria bacterium 13_1_40CM_69_27]